MAWSDVLVYFLQLYTCFCSYSLQASVTCFSCGMSHFLCSSIFLSFGVVFSLFKKKSLQKVA